MRALFLILSLAACIEKEPALRVRVGQVPAEAVSLRVQLDLDGARAKDLPYGLPAGRAAGEIRLGIWLPLGSRGLLHVEVQALDAAGCVRATGGGDGALEGVEADVAVALSPVACAPGGRPGPRISGIGPALLPTTGGTAEARRLTLTGTAFDPMATVEVAGQPTERVSGSATELVVQVPALPGKLGPATIRVRNPDGGEDQRGDLLRLFSPAPAFTYEKGFDSTDVIDSVAAGDMDGDGKLEILATDPALRLVRQAEGRLNASLIAGIRGGPVFMPDLDGDGRADLALVRGHSGSATRGILALRGDGRGGLPAPDLLRDVYLDDLVFSMGLLGDLNRDGLPDLIGQGGTDDTLFHTGSRLDGSYYARTDQARSVSFMGTRALPQASAVVDLDRDGFPEVIQIGGSVLYIGWNRGGVLSWLSYGDVPGAGTGGYFLAVSDVDRDGYPDLLMGVGRFVSTGQVAVRRSLGATGATQAGYFEPPVLLRQIDATRFGLYGLAAGDVDGDGWPDLVTAWQNGSIFEVVLLRNQRNGTFPPEIAMGRAGVSFHNFGSMRPSQMLLVDLDGDGRLDLASACNNSPISTGGVGVLWNRSE